MLRHRCQGRRRGFTLIEVLLVLVILVILVSLVVGTFTNTQREAQRKAARSQVGLFATPLKMYHLDLNTYPNSQQGLQALLAPPPDVPNPAKWKGPYLEQEIPLDPWDQQYRYQYPGRFNPNSYDVWSAGPDGVDGTDDDVGNWQQGT